MNKEKFKIKRWNCEAIPCKDGDFELIFTITLQIPTGGRSFIAFYGSMPCYEDDYDEVEREYSIYFSDFIDKFILETGEEDFLLDLEKNDESFKDVFYNEYPKEEYDEDDESECDDSDESDEEHDEDYERSWGPDNDEEEDDDEEDDETINWEYNLHLSKLNKELLLKFFDKIPSKLSQDIDDAMYDEAKEEYDNDGPDPDDYDYYY